MSWPSVVSDRRETCTHARQHLHSSPKHALCIGAFPSSICALTSAPLARQQLVSAELHAAHGTTRRTASTATLRFARRRYWLRSEVGCLRPHCGGPGLTHRASHCPSLHQGQRNAQTLPLPMQFEGGMVVTGPAGEHRTRWMRRHQTQHRGHHRQRRQRQLPDCRRSWLTRAASA